ncbi:YczE/YyaS/YitT family protein [Metabacillus rhizolycopersici]|uniref:Membrane protein n=1 Tax=Metabacillus rhizolycopersici TaxID=2875709 RepID=A0ABS7UZ10_9BACI|nr:membrane protein [Metabacillus rhizolycopersici]MBZ5753254.1 membrane protein [Metabacillus rhizolycopersici]
MKSFLIYFLGIFISSLGIVAFIKADVGVGGGESVAIGLALHTTISVGIGMMCIHITIILLNSLLLKKLPNFLVLIPVLSRGLTVDIWLYILNNFQADNIIYRFLLLLIGLVLMGFGLGMYLHTRLPKIPVDEFMATLASLNKLSLRINRVIFELSLVGIGFLLGGPVGVGTIIVALGLGPSIQFFYNRFKTYQDDNTKLSQQIKNNIIL